MAIEKKFLTEKEVEQVYGIGVRQLRRSRMAGNGPAWRKVSGTVGKCGGRVLYSVKDVEKWLESRPGGGEGFEG